MALTDLAILGLYATALVFAIIELGLSAHLTDITIDETSAHDRFGYTVFCSLWTMLVAGFLLVFPMLSRRGGNSIQSSHQERWMAPLTLALNSLTMIFWLASFAAIADLYNGVRVTGELAAVLAFAVIEWCVNGKQDSFDADMDLQAHFLGTSRAQYLDCNGHHPLR
jgi:hypothetical protein